MKSLKLSGPNENIEWKVFPLDRILFNCVLSRVRPVVGVLLEQLIGLGVQLVGNSTGPRGVRVMGMKIPQIVE